MPANVTLDDVDRWIHWIYHAAGSEPRWDRLLAQLGEVFESPRSAIVEQDFLARKVTIKYSSGFDPLVTAAYVERFMAKNPWLRDQERYRPGLAWAGREVVPHIQLRGSDFYKEYLAPMDAYHRLCGTLARKGGDVIYLAFLRGRRAPCFSDLETTLLARLLPHIAHALTLHESVMQERSWRETYLRLIDRLPVAVFLVESSGRLLLANSKGERLLGVGCGLRIVGHRLTASSRVDARHLLRALERCAACPSDRQAAKIEHVAVARDAESHPLMLSISPLCHGSARPQEGARSFALITTRDPDQVSILGACKFGSAYELTAAENRLSTLILEGHSLMQAADSLGISHNTARSHMKSIYAKTGTHRQADLIHLHAKSCTDHY